MFCLAKAQLLSIAESVSGMSVHSFDVKWEPIHAKPGTDEYGGCGDKCIVTFRCTGVSGQVCCERVSAGESGREAAQWCAEHRGALSELHEYARQVISEWKALPHGLCHREAEAYHAGRRRGTGELVYFDLSTDGSTVWGRSRLVPPST